MLAGKDWAGCWMCEDNAVIRRQHGHRAGHAEIRAVHPAKIRKAARLRESMRSSEAGVLSGGRTRALGTKIEQSVKRAATARGDGVVISHPVPLHGVAHINGD